MSEPVDDKIQRNQLSDIYRRHWGRLCAYVRAQFGSGPPDPEDVVQQVFEKFASLDNAHQVRSPKAFLNRMAHNVVISEKRRQATRHQYAESARQEDVDSGGYDLNPERVFIAEEQFSMVQQAIAQMPEKRRRILLMNRVHGLSYAEIARQLGVSGTAIKKQMYKAIRELDAVVQQQHSEEGTQS
ncbi:sigma-70 family RNA polymerase sigma factor [Porticoccus sp. W117]|uniref:RNA polymerase sigma factor n=1 Tax=Porticoccus sp. W117 TaxID=3054777 RepID=UPI002599AAD1|nr:sigma-70 family RNA polymerase sigma factor [Porticoccus sp. W117]MDM3871972.1 sigma-70 family RNA polymerase sigma factor [Porticoccus sp. W117]